MFFVKRKLRNKIARVKFDILSQKAVISDISCQKEQGMYYTQGPHVSTSLFSEYQKMNVKEKKKVTLYSYTVRDIQGKIIQSMFSSEVWDVYRRTWGHSSSVLLKTETKEIEVDDE